MTLELVLDAGESGDLVSWSAALGSARCPSLTAPVSFAAIDVARLIVDSDHLLHLVTVQRNLEEVIVFSHLWVSVREGCMLTKEIVSDL